MRAAVFDGNELRVKDFEKPDPEEDEVLIRVEACGICGTDIHIIEDDFPSSPPVVLGHELSGKVEEIGEKVENISVGDRVTVNPNIFCGKCSYCRDGKPNHCKNWQGIGLHRNGGFEGYVAVSGDQVLTFEEIDYSVGAFAEPVACAIRGVDRLDPTLGETALVMGGGPIGLILSQLLSISGIRQVFLSEPVKKKREVAKKLGVDRVIDPGEEDPLDVVMAETEDGVDNAIEATGILEISKKCLEVVKKEGNVLQFGVSPQDAEIVRPFQIYKEEISLVGSFTNPFTTRRAVNLIESGKIELKPLITSEIELEDIGRGMGKFNRKDEIKIMIRP